MPPSSSSTQNVHTYIRVRPFLPSDPHPHKPAFQISHNSRISPDSGGSQSGNGSSLARSFAFDYVFDESHTNAHVFDKIGSSIVNDVLQGRNGVIFAYGQTSSGKTFAIVGNDTDLGILPRSIRALFNSIQRTYHGREFLIRCSYLEIYNETIRDLLKPSQDGTTYKLREKPSGEVFVENLHEVIVCTSEQMNHYVQLGMKHRSVGATSMNQNSSRSHCIFRITVESTEVVDSVSVESPSPSDAESAEFRQRRSSIREKGDWEKALRSKGREVRISHLYVVDLAGSERISQAKTTGKRLKEGNAINQSLSTLSKVISLLAEQPAKSKKKEKVLHIPYRDSKLTRILQVGLGGNSKLTVLCCLTPSAIQETISLATLRFAEMLKRVKNRAKINRVLDDSALLKKYKKEIEELKRQVRMASVDIELQKLQQEKMNAEEAMQLAEKRRKELEDVVEHLTRLIIHGPDKSMDAAHNNQVVGTVAEALKRKGSNGSLSSPIHSPIIHGVDIADVSKKLSHTQFDQHHDAQMRALEQKHREEVQKLEEQYKKQIRSQKEEIDEMQQELHVLSGQKVPPGESATLPVDSPRHSRAPAAVSLTLSTGPGRGTTDVPSTMGESKPKTKKLPLSNKYAFSIELQKLNMALQRMSDSESVYSMRLSDGSLPEEWLSQFENELVLFEEDVMSFRDELQQEMEAVFSSSEHGGQKALLEEGIMMSLRNLTLVLSLVDGDECVNVCWALSKILSFVQNTAPDADIGNEEGSSPLDTIEELRKYCVEKKALEEKNTQWALSVLHGISVEGAYLALTANKRSHKDGKGEHVHSYGRRARGNCFTDRILRRAVFSGKYNRVTVCRMVGVDPKTGRLIFYSCCNQGNRNNTSTNADPHNELPLEDDEAVCIDKGIK
eukprot:CAMPEP_0117452766 /NCGR_PEP_ID=MMETSP0759-20121206/9812_1 /TAXON_ID=63605 /ORGANISM="Percolomonas cosmopolitus, Strain WS" /LENGTH=897 /DNA_ID=CAMNT_0005245647 /DNA_START=204 /DNA_END=2898 /DNA_ORIENTATION=+